MSKSRWIASASIALLVLASAPRADAYVHERAYMSGAWYVTSRDTTGITFQSNTLSLANWVATQPGDFWSRLALLGTTLQAAIDGYEAWEQVPWASITLDYSGGGSTSTGATQNGTNEFWFIASTNSAAAWWLSGSGPTVGKITEGDVRLNTGAITPGRIGAEAVQESGHIIGLDHSPVSNQFTAATDNASMSVGLNLNNDNVLSPDDIAGVSSLYPVLRLRWAGWFPYFTKAHLEDFGTIRGTARGFLNGSPINGAAVLAVSLTSGGAVVGALSGTYGVKTTGTTGDLGADGTGQYELPCLPPGTYAVVCCPLLNYFGSTTRLQANGFDATDLGQSFIPGARIVNILWAGLQVNGINFDGNCGDVNQDGQWTAADLTAFDAFVANPGSYGWLIGAIVLNLCDVNNDGVANSLDRGQIVQLINMTGSSSVAASTF